MQRSSDTIGAIAAALAKAQAELTNPEKALIATIRASNPREKDHHPAVHPDAWSAPQKADHP
jgi:hypothetical protein